MLIQYRGEAEYDFRHFLHTSFRAAVEADVEEVLRLAKQLLKDPGTRLAAAVAGWDQPLSVSDFITASLYTAWTGERHPLIPDSNERHVSDVENRLADMALENMNRR